MMHSTRRAYIEVSAACLADLRPLADAGLEVIASAASDTLGVVKLLIAGDALPAECETGLDATLAKIQTVTVEFTREQTRLTKITVAGA